jgi:hypothetical protein
VGDEGRPARRNVELLLGNKALLMLSLMLQLRLATEGHPSCGNGSVRLRRRCRSEGHRVGATGARVGGTNEFVAMALLSEIVDGTGAPVPPRRSKAKAWTARRRSPWVPRSRRCGPPARAARLMSPLARGSRRTTGVGWISWARGARCCPWRTARTSRGEPLRGWRRREVRRLDRSWRRCGGGPVVVGGLPAAGGPAWPTVARGC